MRYKPSNPTHPLWNREPITAIHAELTDRCNSACPMCPRYIKNGAELNPNLPNMEVSLADFKSWFPVSFVESLKRFYACGNFGDPIVAKDTLEIYQYLRSSSNHLELNMHTNGSARTPDWWTELAKTMNNLERNDYCTFSIDGLSDTNHLYRRNTNFEKIVSNAKSFIGAGGIAHWDFIVFEHNQHQVEEARELAKSLGFVNFNLKRTTRWSDYEATPDGRGYYPVKDRSGATLYELRQPLERKYRDSTYAVLKENLQQPNFITDQEFDRLSYEGTNFVQKSSMGEDIVIQHNTIEVQCRVVRGAQNLNNEIFLSATGHVFPCCFLAGEPWRFDGSNSSGHSRDNFQKMIELNGGLSSIHLREHSLAEILESPIYAEMVRRSFAQGHSMRSRQCSTCCGKSWNKLDHGELGNKHDSFLDPNRRPKN